MFDNDLIVNSCFYEKLINIANMEYNRSASDFMVYLQDLINEIDSYQIAQCAECGHLFSFDMEGVYHDGVYYCDDCQPAPNFIVDYHNYTIRNDTVTTNTFGIELEVEFESEEDRIRCSEEVVKYDLHNIFIMAYDGSLNYGIEFISHVWDLKDINEFAKNLVELTEIIKDCGGFCHYSINSGLHVHIGKSCIDYLENLRNWVYDRPSLFASLSGRIPDNGTFEYARPFDNGRYSFLNETLDTLEFRLWNSTLNPDTIIERILFSFFLVEIFNKCYGSMTEREFFFRLKDYSNMPVMDSSLTVDFDRFAKKWIGKRYTDIINFI